MLFLTSDFKTLRICTSAFSLARIPVLFDISYSCFSNIFPRCPSLFGLLVHALSLAPRQPFLKPLLLFGFSLSTATVLVPKPNPRFNADVPRQFSALLGFTTHLSLVAKSTSTRTPVKRKVVRLLGQGHPVLSSGWATFFCFFSGPKWLPVCCSF